MEKDLFEEVCHLAQCGFVSDLRNPDRKWIGLIRQLKLEEYSLKSWKELLRYMQYIGEESSFKDYDELKNTLNNLDA